MTLSRADHPCLSCRLPDCDDTSRRCALRRAICEYDNHIRARAPVPSDVRSRYVIARSEFYRPLKGDRPR